MVSAPVEERQKRRKARRSETAAKRSSVLGGWLQALLDLFRPGKDRKAAAPAPVERTSFLPRFEEVLREMGASPPDAAVRLATLRILVARLEALFRDLVSAGDRQASTQKLGETLQQVHTLLVQPTPPDADVHAVWDALAATLRDGSAVDAPRGSWWK